MKTFRYILRYYISPGYHENERIEELIEFCIKSKVEEVMLFGPAEELTPGHLTEDELKSYASLAKKLKEKLNAQGIDLSLNPWTTTYHTARGRKLREGQNFTLMVREDGTDNGITACPLCPEWQKYICDVFAYLAKEVKPVAIWVEDDWRLHNHGPGGGWGGCFCKLHLDRFSEKIGKKVSREELIENILKPGKPHPWRTIWIDIWRESLIEPAEKLRQAVQSANPTTKLALMSSNPDTHSIEGRDWIVLERAFGNEPAFLIRPHLPPYVEAHTLESSPSVTRHTIANLDGAIEIYPELENCRSGQYSKCGTYSLWECYNSACFGSDGITINHYDMMGTGINLDRGFSKFLSSAKPILNAITKLNIDDRKADGVRVLFSPDVARFIYSKERDTIRGLTNQSVVWSDVFFVLGISHRITKEITLDGTPYAVGDQTLRAFSEDKIRNLLSGPVLLDGCSADILLERGFGRLIGIKSGQWIEQYKAIYAYEQIEEADKTKYGLAYPRMTAQRCSKKLFKMESDEQAKVLSWIYDPWGKKLFPGAILFENECGGKIFITSYPMINDHDFFMGFFNVYRREFYQRLIFSLAPNANLLTVSNHPVFCYRQRTKEGTFVGIINSIIDSAEEIVLRIPVGQLSPKNISVLGEEGNWGKTSIERKVGTIFEEWKIRCNLGPLGGLFLLIAG